MVKTVQRVGSATTRCDDPPANTNAMNECDTNADTCCLGKNFLVLSYTTRTADVYAYDTSIEPIENVPIITGATAFDDPDTGTTYILVFNESLYYGTRLDHSLINPNQMRHYGVECWDNPFDKQRGLKIVVDQNLVIPLSTKGTKIMFTSRVPTRYKLENCQHIPVTSPRSWEPATVQLQQASSTRPARQLNPYSMVRHYDGEYRYGYVDLQSDNAILHEINPCLIQLKELATSRIKRFLGGVDADETASTINPDTLD